MLDESLISKAELEKQIFYLKSKALSKTLSKRKLTNVYIRLNLQINNYALYILSKFFINILAGTRSKFIIAFTFSNMKNQQATFQENK